ncbi:MAG: DUF2279 domain-containing protein [Deltaproteobacteria bacterium]|nr:DUF2279 domain-containing protein [Deltaproteobacteria bacterium]
MTYPKFACPGLCIGLMLCLAVPALGQDTDVISDSSPSPKLDSDAAAANVSSDSDPSSSDDAATADASASVDEDNANQGVADQSEVVATVPEKKRPAPRQQITVELAGPSTAAPLDNTAAPLAAESPSTALQPPKVMNPFLALGDEMFLGMALLTAWGIHFWDWFEQGFHFKKEHGFTQESSTGGADKTGHFFTAYIFADFLNWRLRRQGWPRLRSAIVGSSVAMGLMTWIEVGDGTSAYGWSWEDMLADFIGVAISAGLATFPVADDLFDFRMEYWPTSSYLKGGVMAADYSGMKYLMAFRLSGIKPIKRTPFRLIELHLGYYSRGFRSFDKTKDTNRVVYWGIGLDLKELFNKMIPNKKVMRPFDVAFTYYQPPYTSWTVHKWEHKWSANPPAQTVAATTSVPAP